MIKDHIERAAKLVKILQLASEPGHDRISIALNCEPNYKEIIVGMMWAKAFEIAEKGNGTAFEQAVELRSYLG